MRKLVLPILLLGIPALGVGWFLTSYERVPVKRMTGLTGEARLRDFLAAERFAERMGMKASEVRSLPELHHLPPRGVLLMPARRQGLEKPEVEGVLAWVAGGGHLIVEAEYAGVDDPLCDGLGVTRETGEAARNPIAVEVKGERHEVQFVDALRLRANVPPRLRAGDRLIVFAHGEGLVTAASSLQFARNELIGQLDHAPFLWALLQQAPARELRVFFRPERLSLWEFLRENALPVLLAAGALLALWLWRIVPRFGPVAPDVPPARRRLLDHLRASGRYYWSNGLRSRLVVAARDAALRRIAHAQPDFAEASPAERAARLASLIGISEQEAHGFLGAAGAMRGADFIRITQHAQRVHSVLQKGDDR
jgi:hypothetical protein